MSGIDENGVITDPDSEKFKQRLSTIKAKIPNERLNLEQLQVLNEMSSAATAKEVVGVVIAATKHLPKILSRHPTAIIINLNAYVKTIGGL